jgi:putative cardiolipin synthase
VSYALKALSQMPVSRSRIPAVLLVLIAAAVLTACSLAPAREPLPVATALPPAETGVLSDANHRVTEQLADGESAFWLLDRADFSFEARLALIDQAISSLDIQYFIWEKDPSSRLFTHRIVLAADRGVRVRILLDDLTLNDQDAEYHALSHHPNIEVRTFNPWNLRSNIGRVLEFMVRWPRLNHRMHNKIIVADNRFAIIGGRNIGDRYFGLWDDFVQNDLDVLTVGPLGTATTRTRSRM